MPPSPPPKPLSATLLLCEKILNEDGVFSIIRIGDLYYVPSVPDIPPEKQVVLMNLLIMCTFEADDQCEHLITLRLKRPDGSEKYVELEKPLTVDLGKLPPKFPDVPRKINFIAAPWGVKPTHMGVHCLILAVDGQDYTSTFFTLARPPAETK